MRQSLRRAFGAAISGLMLILLAASLHLGSISTPAVAQSAQQAPPAAPPKSFLPPKATPGAGSAVDAPAPPSGLRAWFVHQQRKLNTALAGALRDIKAGHYVSATLLLMMISFGYGIAHAAGPGHGKAIVSSYLLADRQTVGRGVILAFMSAFVQALSAIVIFGIVVLIVRGTIGEVRATEVMLERASWAIVALFGLWLLWRQVRALVTGRAVHDHAHHHGGHDHAHHHHSHGHHGHGHDHGHGHAHHGHGHGAKGHHDHGAAHGHDHACETCGHSHMPGPSEIGGADWSLRRALGLAFTIGIRPCTGAIGVLFFANAIGLMWAGIVSTFAMAVGTAITVSFLAILTVVSRDWAARLAGAGDNRWAGHVQTAAGLIGAVLVTGLGVLLFLYPLSEAAPF